MNKFDKKKRKKIMVVIIIVLLIYAIPNCINSKNLVLAIRDNDMETIQETVSKPGLYNGINTLPLFIPWNSPLISEMTFGINVYPLEEACFRGNFEAAKILVENGANVNKVDYGTGRNTPLTTALKEEYEPERYKIAKYLIEHGADINHKTSENEVPLTLCLISSKKPEHYTEEIQREQMELFKYLLENCKSIDVPEYDWAGDQYHYSTLLEATIVYDNLNAMRYLIDNGYYSDSDIPKLNGSQISYLASMGRVDIFKYYYTKNNWGKELNEKDDLGRTPLHNAAINKKATLCEFLLDQGADYTIKDNDGKTAYDYAKEAAEPSEYENTASDLEKRLLALFEEKMRGNQ